jgi:hypothetical protein
MMRTLMVAQVVVLAVAVLMMLVFHIPTPVRPFLVPHFPRYTPSILIIVSVSLNMIYSRRALKVRAERR